jgi:hypothetical protein
MSIRLFSRINKDKNPRINITEEFITITSPTPSQPPILIPISNET